LHVKRAVHGRERAIADQLLDHVALAESFLRLHYALLPTSKRCTSIRPKFSYSANRPCSASQCSTSPSGSTVESWLVTSQTRELPATAGPMSVTEAASGSRRCSRVG